MEKLLDRYPSLRPLAEDIRAAADALIASYRAGGKLLACGNGGSAADCDHIVGELMKSFKIRRGAAPSLCEALTEYGEDGAFLASTLEEGLPAISLCEHRALSTAFANDRDPVAAFAQQVSVLGHSGDVLIALSTSGNARNCCLAAITARAMGLTVIAITGENGGRLATLADIALRLPERETYLVQELTLPIYHYLCAEIEANFFGK